MDRTVFDEAALMERLEGDIELRELLVDTFVRDSGTLLERLEHALAAQARSDAEFAAHALRGAAANLAAGRVEEAALAVEQAAAAGDLKTGRTAQARLVVEVARLLAVLRGLRDPRAAPSIG
jgi:HPt (histidine-containing phosphotransfer) domain-containing protein